MFGWLRSLGRVDYQRSARELRAADRSTAAEIAAIHRSLSAWVGRPKTEAVDQLLDELLYRRPADVMASAGEWGLAA